MGIATKAEKKEHVKLGKIRAKWRDTFNQLISEQRKLRHGRKRKHTNNTGGAKAK